MYGIIKREVQDSLNIFDNYLWNKQNVEINELDITDKERFVYKYLDALNNDKLKNVAPEEDYRIIMCLNLIGIT